jgi:septal ring factor EnvC (AmiA/AmiB activator)
MKSGKKLNESLVHQLQVLSLNKVFKSEVESLKKKVNNNRADVEGQLTYLKSQEKTITAQGKKLRTYNNTIQKQRTKIAILDNKTQVLEQEIQGR